MSAMTGVIANGLSGRSFNFVSSSDARNVPPHDTWSGLPANNPYRQEWDSFARQLGVAPRERQNFALIKDAMRRYHEMVTHAASRGVSLRPTARADAAAQARAALFAPTQVQSMAQLTSGSGTLATLAKSGVTSLVQSPALATLPWGASLQQAASNPQTVLSFYSGIAQGVFEGGKDLVVGLASFAGSAVQYSADVTVGPAFDALRQALPSGVQAWIGNNANALIPSGERGAASTQKMGDALSKVGSYIANRTPEQVGNDIAGFVQQHWDSLKGSHAEAVAKGPEAEARWWGQVTGRSIFEIAAVAVPVTKVAQLAKLGQVAEVVEVARVVNAAEAVSVVTNPLTISVGSTQVSTIAVGGKALAEGRTALTFDKVTRVWATPAGLAYAEGSAQGNRVKHVLEHAVPDPLKHVHSVFNVGRSDVLRLIDEAWQLRQGPGTLQKNGNRVWDVPMGRVVGTNGESTIRIIVKDGTTQITTAFPK